ncbi:unnamed protein product [Mytilus coruscus]|uniref:Homeobox domain-containing protein n=1 Tax=Mytilus coruscus TaxID=42192 RepID=A0A6J8DR07_MYTCO|nr:unnamed protein product [Mytilus coruscus]
MIAFYYEKKSYRQVFELLATGKFSDHSGLIEIWDNAQYALKEEQVGKPLTPLMKFRTRQKFPPPFNISPSGGRPTAKLSDQAKSVLKSWWSENSQNPYPTQGTREEIANRAGLTNYQVKTWFANARRRQKMSTERNQMNYELYMKKKRELLSTNSTQARPRTAEIDKPSASTEIHSIDNTNLHGTGTMCIPQCTTTTPQQGFEESLQSTIQGRHSSQLFRYFVTIPKLMPLDYNNNFVYDGIPAVHGPNFNESISTNCIQNLTQLCRNVDSSDAGDSVYPEFQSRNPISHNSGLRPFVNVQNNYHHAFRYQNIDDTLVSFGLENQFSPVPNYWPCVRNTVQNCSQVTDTYGLNNMDGRNSTHMCNHSDNRQASGIFNPRAEVNDQVFSNPVCLSQHYSPRVPTFSFQQNDCTTLVSDQSLTNTPRLFSHAVDISTKGLIESQQIKNFNGGIHVVNVNRPALLSRPSSCPLPATASEKLRYLLTNDQITRSNYQIKEENYNKRYSEQEEVQTHTNCEIKQDTEENDIAKVLLDFSSQSVDSSQDSS